MPTVNQYLKYAEIALASYGLNLVLGVGANAQKYVDAGMATSQAARFNQQWSVLAQTDIGDGFSAALFQRVDANGVATGEKVLGIRGTETSHYGIDFVTDVVNIAVLGTSVGMPQYQSLEAFYQQLVTNGKLGAAEQLTVSGHSLGGFLAQAFTAKHDAVVTATYTYNSPGFSVAPGVISNIGTELLEFFGISDASIPSGKIFNARAIDGPSATAGLGQMIGYVDVFNIERGNPVANHSIVTLTDSLAVQEWIAHLDIGASHSSTNALVRSASNAHVNTLESLVDSVRGLLVGPSAAATPVDDRNMLYANMQAFADSGTIQSLAGKLRITPIGNDLATKARPEFNSFASLLTLSPFKLEGSHAANQSLLDTVLQGAWGTIHADWLADKSMSQADLDAGRQTFTDEWIADRAGMIGKLVERNQRNLDPYANATSAYQGRNVLFEDFEQGIRVSAGTVANISGNYSVVAFGKEGDDLAGELIGRDGSDDRLYGMGGNDTVIGYGGNDRLEGNAGNDSLSGVGDADTLLGGAGNDTLDGGADNDLLLGGQGADIYKFAGTWGADTVIDSDGQGSIEVAGLGPITGAGVKRVSPNSWQTPDRQVNYTLVTVDAGRTDLIITFADQPNVITIRNWSEAKNLGIINLNGAVEATPSPGLRELVQLHGIEGFGFLTDPVAYHIIGGTGENKISTREFDDIVEGGLGEDEIHGNAGNDFLYADFAVDLQAAIDGAMIDQSLVQFSLLEGDSGDDVMIGANSNYLYGGGGRDIMVGGGAADIIQGDTYDGGHSKNSGIVTPHYEYEAVKQKYNYYVTVTAGAQTSYFARLGHVDAGGAGDPIITGAGDDRLRSVEADDDCGEDYGKRAPMVKDPEDVSPMTSSPTCYRPREAANDLHRWIAA